MKHTVTADDGFTQNGNGLDGPRSESDWPNQFVGYPPHMAVWLR